MLAADRVVRAVLLALEPRPETFDTVRGDLDLVERVAHVLTGGVRQIHTSRANS